MTPIHQYDGIGDNRCNGTAVHGLSLIGKLEQNGLIGRTTQHNFHTKMRDCGFLDAIARSSTHGVGALLAEAA